MLDAVGAGRESFVVVRRGREVATISPASAASGRRLKALLEEHRPDPAWARELGELRAALVDEPLAADAAGFADLPGLRLRALA
jgi:hypothetical protein